MRESELQYQQISVQGEPLEVFRSVIERARRCGYLAGTIEPQGQYLPGDIELVIDLDLHGDFAPSFRTEFGRLRLTPADGGTLVRIGTAPFLSTHERQGQRVHAVLADPSLPCNA